MDLRGQEEKYRAHHLSIGTVRIFICTVLARAVDRWSSMGPRGAATIINTRIPGTGSRKSLSIGTGSELLLALRDQAIRRSYTGLSSHVS